MIFGIGTDIVEIDRIKSLASLNKFAIKILSQKELRFFDSLGSEKKITYISKQFAGSDRKRHHQRDST